MANGLNSEARTHFGSITDSKNDAPNLNGNRNFVFSAVMTDQDFAGTHVGSD